MRRLTLVALLAVGCSSGTPVPSEEPGMPRQEQAPRGAADGERDEVPAESGAPASAGALARALRARHAEDLPDAAALRAYDAPAAALRWIAVNDRRLVVRGRALVALASFADDATRSLLMTTITAPDAHPVLVASAVTGSGGLALDEALRTALESARAGGDPRVARAVESRLGPEPVEDVAGPTRRQPRR